MRGYSTLPALVLTLASEWPALIATVAFLRSDTVPSISSREAGRRFMWAIIVGLVACLLPHLNDDNAAQFLIPNVPGQHMQSIGTLAFRATTCVLPQIKVSAVLAPQKHAQENKATPAPQSLPSGSHNTIFFVSTSSSLVGC